MTLEALLQQFRSGGKPQETFIMVVNDGDAKKVMAAWSTMPVPTWFPPDHAQPTDERQLWEWLWFTVEPDFDDLATRAGVTPITAKNKFLMLKAARLIYPDGEVNEWGLALLRSDIAKALKAPAKAKKR